MPFVLAFNKWSGLDEIGLICEGDKYFYTPAAQTHSDQRDN